MRVRIVDDILVSREEEAPEEPCLESGATLGRAAEVMVAADLRCVRVVRGGELLGMVRLEDVFFALGAGGSGGRTA